MDGTKKVIPSGRSYQGLSYETSMELRAYMHLRQPENLQCIALLKRPGIVKTDDFLDCIDKDTPKGKNHTSYDGLSFKSDIYDNHDDKTKFSFLIFFFTTEMWVVTHDNAATTAHVRNLYWEGFGFFTVLKGKSNDDR